MQVCDWATFYQGMDFLYDATKVFDLWDVFSSLPFSRSLALDRLPEKTFSPWQDLFHFYENITRPLFLNGSLRRRLPTDRTWSMAEYHDRYISKSLWYWMVLANVVAIAPIGLLFAANIIAIKFTLLRKKPLTTSGV